MSRGAAGKSPLFVHIVPKSPIPSYFTLTRPTEHATINPWIRVFTPTSVSPPCKNMGIFLYAGMVELVDSVDLGSSAERRAGSSPVTRTKKGAH